MDFKIPEIFDTPQLKKFAKWFLIPIFIIVGISYAIEHFNKIHKSGTEIVERLGSNKKEEKNQSINQQIKYIKVRSEIDNTIIKDIEITKEDENIVLQTDRKGLTVLKLDDFDTKINIKISASCYKTKRVTTQIPVNTDTLYFELSK